MNRKIRDRMGKVENVRLGHLGRWRIDGDEAWKNMLHKQPRNMRAFVELVQVMASSFRSPGRMSDLDLVNGGISGKGWAADFDFVVADQWKDACPGWSIDNTDDHQLFTMMATREPGPGRSYPGWPNLVGGIAADRALVMIGDREARNQLPIFLARGMRILPPIHLEIAP